MAQIASAVSQVHVREVARVLRESVIFHFIDRRERSVRKKTSTRKRSLVELVVYFLVLRAECFRLTEKMRTQIVSSWVGCLVGWLAGWLAGWVGCQVGCQAGWLVGWLVGCLLG